MKGILKNLHGNFGSRCFMEKKLCIAMDFSEQKWAKQTD